MNNTHQAHLPLLSRIYKVWQRVKQGNAGVLIENRFRAMRGEPRLLLRYPDVDPECGYSVRRINALLHSVKHRGGAYLEIGVFSGETLEQINSADKYGVDPEPMFDISRLPHAVRFFHGTSDQFFDMVPRDLTWDVIFIDGLHTYGQTYRDLHNGLLHLKPGGAILIDDTVPCDEISALPNLEESQRKRLELGLKGLPWHGDVWKVVIAVAKNHPELDYRTLIGSGNPQTLIWRKTNEVRPFVPSERPTIDADVAALSYSDVFVDGVPLSFRPSTESAAILDYLSATSEK